MNGIELDKNLRQPSYYSTINYNELKSEVFGIIADLLTTEKVPIWLSQRIAWFYADKYLSEIMNDLTELSNTSGEIESIDYVDSTEPKIFHREKMVVYLRNSISKIIKEWQIKKSTQLKQNILFSFSRFEQNITNNLKYSEFGIKNKRRIMEDKVAIIENINLFQSEVVNNRSKRPGALFGVFDGHCGVDCALYVSKQLPMYIIQHPEFTQDINKVFVDSFDTINKRFTSKSRKEPLRSGSTACLALMTSGNTESPNSYFTGLDVAWCGDTRFGLVKDGKLYFVTNEHKPDDLEEKARIEAAGGSVTFTSGAWRIDSALSVSRSFGDVDYQPSVISDPEIKHFELDGSEDYFIIGCDGLWEALDQNELCSFIYENVVDSEDKNSLNIAELLVRKAQSNGSLDNITAIFVLLKDDLTKITNPKCDC